MPCHLGGTVMVKDAMKKSLGVPEIYHTKQSRVNSQASTHFSQNRQILRQLSESISRILDSQTVTDMNEMQRALCNKLLVQLPARELRDIIYEDIVPAKTVIVVAGDEDTSGSVGQTEACCPTSAPSTPCNLVWNADTKHLWKCEKVGHALLSEMIQTWYRKQTFVITDFELIADFVLSDCWGLGVVPCQHLTHVQVSLDQGEIIQDVWKIAPPHVWKLRADLGRLGHFRPGTCITVCIKSTPCRCDKSNHSSLPRAKDHHCPIWERDNCEILEAVESLEVTIFSVLRKLLSEGQLLRFILDDLLEITPTRAEDICYDIWCAKILEYHG